MGGIVDTVAWDAPWFQALGPLRPLFATENWRGALNAAARDRAVVSGRGVALEFVEPDAAGEIAYELFIAQTGKVPTRDNLHDRFNALMWLAYPRAKAALNARQADEIERHGVGPARGAIRDAATLIDESGLLLLCAPDAIHALCAHDWRRLLIDWRDRWVRDIVALPFGHALLEKLVGPFKAVTACVVPLSPTNDPDAAAAAFFTRPDLAPSLLPHLPVLGIPGWCAQNADPRFYDDPTVFRPRRSGSEKRATL